MKKLIGVLPGVVAVLLSLNVGASELIPLNVGEVLIPTGDKELWTFTGATKDCAIKSVYGTGVSLRHYAKTGTGSFTMSRHFQDLDCTGFDDFIFYFNNAHEKVNVTVTLETDAGQRKSAVAGVSASEYVSWTELAVPLEGAEGISSISITIAFEKEGLAGGGLMVHGLMLRNTREFAAFRKHWERFSELKWDGMLQPESFEPKFKLSYGLFFNDADVEEYRSKYRESYESRRASLEDSPAPEFFIDNAMYAGGGTRQHLCERYMEAFGGPYGLPDTGNYLAFSALVAQDKGLMRMAARYALTIASFGSWNDCTMRDIVGGGVWPAFAPSGVALSLAFTLDCAGEMLTPQGRNYVLKALMLKGVGPITYSMWARGFAWHSNQGMVFLRGKMASLLVFDKVWPRVDPIVQNTKAEADECMNNIFRPDGSYMESYTYMAYTISCTAPLYEMYACMSGKKLADVLPENLSRSGAFADVVCSTNRHPDRAIITFGQASSWRMMHPFRAAFMAAAVPDSMWVNLYNRISEAEIGKSYPDANMGLGIRLQKLNALAVAGEEAKPQPLVVLKDSGLVSSTRYLDGQPVKIVMVGDAIGVGKKHYDVGSFVLEFAGDTFAMDMPVFSGIYAEAQYHNVLVAVTAEGRLTNSLYFTDGRLYSNADKRNSQRPEATGDEKTFSGKINPSASWEAENLKKWVRKIESPTPDVVRIIDEYQLGSSAQGVAFIWITYLPVEVKGDRVLITGEYGGRAELTIPPGCEVEIEKCDPGASVIAGMALPKGHQCSRIIIRKDGEANAEGRLEVEVRLSYKEGEQAPPAP